LLLALSWVVCRGGQGVAQMIIYNAADNVLEGGPTGGWPTARPSR
jgi:hypothetical protein